MTLPRKDSVKVGPRDAIIADLKVITGFEWIIDQGTRFRHQNNHNTAATPLRGATNSNEMCNM